MNKDRFGRDASDVTSPARDGFAIIPNDATDLVAIARGIYVGVGGDVVVDFVGYQDDVGETDVTFLAVPSGSILPISVAKVKTASTATGMVAIY